MSSAIALFEVTTRPYCVLFATIGHILISLSTQAKTALKTKDRAKLFILLLYEILKINAHFATNTTF